MDKELFKELRKRILDTYKDKALYYDRYKGDTDWEKACNFVLTNDYRKKEKNI